MKYVIKHTLVALTLLLAANAKAAGIQIEDILDDVPTFDASLPRPEAVTGVRVGERHWYHHEIVRYLDALAEASPRMVALGAHATSYGGRELVSYAISTERNLARLDEIKAARADLIDPDADVDLSAQPAVMHMMYSIHGNEPSGTNSTPLVAWYLTAAQDAELEAQLDEVVIIFNPTLNPDGLDRFAHWSNRHRGMTPSSDPNDREHTEGFPSGRTNYYWFDLNRDWLPHQHPESRGRLALFHEWKPNVQLDFHEQGSNASYFFMPGKPERTNPLTPPINQELTAKIGEYHARLFDADGIRYFSEERYDDFFMGKGSTYPDLFGCVGILFEQPSARGAMQDTRNGLLTFPDSIGNQFRASLSSIEATAELRGELLSYQRNFYGEVDSRGGGHYLARAEGDPTRLAEFVRVLEGHDIDVEVLTRDVRSDGQLYPAGQTIAVPVNQPQATYLATLWNRQVEFDENVFYDVSTWTMPWAFNLTHTREPVRGARTAALPEDFPERGTGLAESQIGYLIDWRDSAAASLLYALLDAGANVRVAESPFTAEIIGRGLMSFGYGTLLVSPELREDIPEEAMALMQAAAEAGTPVFPAASSYTPEGIDLGSRDFHVLELPKVLMPTGPGVSAYNSGEIWHLLDTRVSMPITMVDTDRLSRVELGEYTHILLPNPIRALPESVMKKMEAFVRGGGIIWAQGAPTVEWLRDKGLTSVLWRETAAEQAERELEKKLKDAAVANDETEALLPERRPFAAATNEAAYKLVRGTILEGAIDVTHPLGYGYTDSFVPLFRRDAKFMARSDNAYSTPVVYDAEPLLSGYISDENLELASGSAGLIIDEKGDGAIVLALDSMTFRAFWWGTQKILLNAIFFGGLLEEP